MTGPERWCTAGFARRCDAGCWSRQNPSPVPLMGRLEALAVRHLDALYYAALVITGFAVLWPALTVYPTFVDNVVSLSVAERDSAWAFWHDGVFSFQPTYRPLPYTTLWLQAQLLDLHVWTYHLVNVVIWIACGCLLYAIVRRLSGFRLIAFGIALAVLFDERAEWNLWVILERQTSLAVLAGLLALLLTLRLSSFRRRNLTLVAIGALLVLSSLSIEYGLAFSAAVFTAGVVSRPGARRGLMVASFVAVAVYTGLRLGATGGVSRDFCENMGYFTQLRPDPTCLSSLSTEVRVKQHLYNVGAGLVGIVFPSLFSYDGVWEPYAREKYKLAVSMAVFLLALFGLARRPRETIPFLALWVANAALLFFLYRSRNQVVGMIGIYTSAGIGAGELTRLAKSHLRHARLAVAGAALLIGAWLVFIGLESSDRLRTVRAQERRGDPCRALVVYPDDASRQVVAEIKRRYRMSNIECAG